MVLVVGVWVVPSVAILIESFRPEGSHLRTGFWTAAAEPDQLTVDNYRTVLESGGAFGMVDSLISSFAIVLPSTVVPVLLAAAAAYAFAFLDFRGREKLFVSTVSLMALPVQMTLIPLLTTFVHGAHLTFPLTDRTVTLMPDLDLQQGAAAAWLAQAAFALPFAIFLLHNTFAALPRELLDAARIDGADHLAAFLRIVVPLSIPAIASLAVLQFIWSWNELLIPQVLMSGADPVHLPTTVRLASIVGEPSGAGPTAAAAVLVQATVPLLVFFALQRHIVRGLLTGATGD